MEREKNPWIIGGRTIKTVIAVFLCFLIDAFRASGMPFYAAIAAILCVQPSRRDSLRTAKTREIATVIGGLFGMLFLLFEQYVYSIPVPILRYMALSVLLIPIIHTSVWLKQDQGTYLMCVVFLCVTITHAGDASPVAFAVNRIIDTTIGIAVALLVNQIPIGAARRDESP